MTDCKTLHLNYTEAEYLVERFQIENLEDDKPTIVTDLNGNEYVVADSAAKDLLTQIQSPNRESYSLFVSCEPGSLGELIQSIEVSSALKSFFDRLKMYDGSKDDTIEDYINKKQFTPAKLESLINIAEFIGELEEQTKGSGDDSAYFFPATIVAINRKLLPEVEKIAERIKSGVFSKLVNKVTPGLMTTQIMTLAAIDDYEELLAKEYTSQQKYHLPVILNELSKIRKLVVECKIKSVYAPNLVSNGAAAEYRPNENALLFSEIAPQRMFDRESASGLRHSAVILHELTHALQDYKKSLNYSGAVSESEAHFVEMYYKYLKDGAEVARRNLTNEDKIFAQQGYSTALEKANRYLGYDLRQFARPVGFRLQALDIAIEVDRNLKNGAKVNLDLSAIEKAIVNEQILAEIVGIMNIAEFEPWKQEIAIGGQRSFRVPSISFSNGRMTFGEGREFIIPDSKQGGQMEAYIREQFFFIFDEYERIRKARDIDSLENFAGSMVLKNIGPFLATALRHAFIRRLAQDASFNMDKFFKDVVYPLLYLIKQKYYRNSGMGVE